jgi:hypothetical protein
MPDCFLGGLKINDVIRDVKTGELVLLTNGICSLAHNTPAAYGLAHTDGCRYVPSEGLVFVGPADKLETWGMKDIQGREFVKADDADAVLVKAFFEKRCDEMRRGVGRRRKTVRG